MTLVHALAIVARPFVAFSFLFIATALAHIVKRYIPEGRVKRTLYRKHDLIKPYAQ